MTPLLAIVLVLAGCVSSPDPWVRDVNSPPTTDVNAHVSEVDLATGSDQNSNPDAVEPADLLVEVKDDAAPCIPQCNGKECGFDGCQGSCGTCDEGESCNAGTCNLTDICGNDFCGEDEDCTSCAQDCSCQGATTCVAGACVDCAAYCIEADFQCGSIGACSCGTCGTDQICKDHLCQCKPACGGKLCGDDGCGGSCGSCTSPAICQGGNCIPASCQGEFIDFSDPALESLVRTAAGVPAAPLDLDILMNVTSISNNCPADAGCVESLEGIECLLYLKTLSLTGHAITDLSPLLPLQNLTYLSIQGNPITDFSPLGSLVTLSNLGVGESAFSDLAVLADLDALQLLYCNFTNLVNLTGIEEMTNLKSFSVFGVKTIGNYGPLANASSLETLDLSQNGLSSLNVLSGPANLESLFVSFNPLTNLHGLDTFPQLRELLAEDCSLSDISELTYLTKLETLNLKGNQITDISPLVANEGIGPGDSIDLTDNPLDCTLVGYDLQKLIADNVEVLSDCP